MAGDWIKLEATTLQKPEILEAAEMLSISRREAIGLFVDYFVWLDQHLDETCPGFVPHVSRKSLEVVLACPGFAAVLETIRWGKFDDRTRTLTVVNHERHNGKTAKTRALDQRKKAEQRRNVSRKCPDEIGTVSGTNSGPEVEVEVRTSKKRSSAESIVDNSNATGETWAQHWTAKGKALGIHAHNGESETAYCKRVKAVVRDRH